MNREVYTNTMDTAERPPQPVTKPIEIHPAIPATGGRVPDASGFPPGAPAPRAAKELAFSLPSYLDSFQGEPETKEFLGNLLDTNFNHIENFLDAGSASDIHVATVFGRGLSDLMNRVVAEEFQCPQTFVPPPELGGNYTLVADQVLMLKRSAFIHDIINKSKLDPKTKMFQQPPSFIFLDLKDLFSANMAGAADWMLSSVARRINEVASGYMKEISKTNSEAGHATCRYGGDEFVVGTAGLTTEQNQELQRLLSESIAGLDGYYMDASTGKIKQQKIELNKEKSTILDIPLHPVDRRIFMTYLNRGLILDREQVIKVREMYTVDDTFDMARFSAVSARDSALRSTEEKITAILFGDPNLSHLMTMADYMDQREARWIVATGGTGAGEITAKDGGSIGKKEHSKRKENLVALLENVVYDALLGENVVSLEGLQTQIQKGNITKMACVDLKFIKEINDASSYAEGDMAIDHLWQTLSLRLSPPERRSLVIARRGGTFILAQRRNAGEVLAENWLETYMNDLAVKVKGNEVAVPLGMSYQEIPEPRTVGRPEAGRVMGQVLQASEADWYRKVATEIGKNDKLKEVFDNLHAALQAKNATIASAVEATAKDFASGMREAPDKNGLILSFFFGKPGLRTDMRVSRIMSELYPPEPATQEAPGTVQ